jgi:BirA family transcriptional regulator, biotin operon repressor / biotin---[acetyl-CoA-carboxylase] ligase
LYKIQPKTLFVGKKTIYLPSCQSTNDEAAGLLRSGEGHEGTVVITDYQTAGRGQRGNTWLAQAGENLTLSLILKPRFLSVQAQFSLNIAVSLGVYDFLETYLSDDVRIKWPNDIYAKDRKLGGILIENTLQNSHLESTIVGMGLNINQLAFENPQATSLRLLTQQAHDLEKLLPTLLEALEKNYLLLRNGHQAALKQRYLQRLYRYQEMYRFRKNEEEFEGMIVGVSATGLLAVQIENRLEYFDFKEISYVF